MKNDKESKPFKTIYDIYKASDTYSGVHYAKGGLTDAKYVSKRNSQVVDDNGKIVSDKLNGVWLKETAKPVGSIEGTEAMELKTAADWENYLKGGSGSQEVELTPNVIRKGMYGWKGKTYSKGQINGYDWDITTIKVSSGKLVSSIQGGSRSKGDGFESFQFTMFQDPSANLIVTSPKVVNEKRVREQHEQAVEEFKRLVREGRLPEKKYGKGGKLFGAGNFAEGGSIGFIPMDMEEKLRLIGKWGDISIKQVIGLLNAMIDSGVTDEDLVPKPKKNTSFQREKATEAKIKEIWTKIEPNYKGDLIGNHYYSSLKELIGRNWIYKDLLKNYKPLRKLHKEEVEIKKEEVRKMSGGDAVLYKDEQWYVTEKNGHLGIGNFRQGAWGMDFPFIPLSRIDMDSLTDMMGRKVQIVKGYAKGGMFGAGHFAEGGEIVVKSGINGNLQEVFRREKNQRNELLANEIFDDEKSKGNSVFLMVDGELYDSYTASGDEDSYASGGKTDKANDGVQFIDQDGNKAIIYTFTNKGNVWRVMIMWGKNHIIDVTKRTNNPFGGKIGTWFDSIDEAVNHYKDVNIKSNILFAESVAKEHGYTPKYAKGGTFGAGNFAEGGEVNEDDYRYAKTRGIDNLDLEKEMKEFYGADWDKLTDYEKEILIEDNKKEAKRSMAFAKGGKIGNPITFGDLKVGEIYFQVTRPDLGIEKITITSINGNRGYEYVSDKRSGNDPIYATKYQGTYSDREELYGIYRNVNDAKNKAIELLIEKMSKYAKGGTFGAGRFAEGGKLENISPILKPKIEAIEKILPKALGESSMKIEFAFQTNTGYAFNMISRTDLPVNRATPKLKKIGVEVERTGEKGRRLITIPRGIFDKMTAIYADGGLIEDLYNQRRLTDIQIRTQLVRILGVDRASDFMARDNNREHGVSAMSLLLSAVSKGWLSVDEIDFNMYYAAESAADETAELEEIGSSDLNFILKEMLENGGIEMGYEGNRIVRKYSNPEEVNIKDKTHRNGK